MKTSGILAVLALSAHGMAQVVFDLSSEPNGQGVRKTFFINRWKCTNLADEDFDKQASWAYVSNGLANGCTLYDEPSCKGESVNIEKNNSDILGPGPVNLTDVDFDKLASSFSCY